MSYIIVFNVGSRDAFVHKNAAGFVEEFEEWEDAVVEGKACLDEEYRNFKVYEEEYENGHD